MAHPVDGWHDLVSRRDLTRLDGLLAEDVVFHSPVVHTPQQGRAITAAYLRAAFGVLLNDTFTYVRDVRGPADAVLEFAVDVDGTHVNGVDMLHFDDAGRIDDFKVLLRPLRAVNLVHRMMGEALQGS